LKLPKKMVPKRLPLVYFLLNDQEREKFQGIADSKNWSFSLMSFDVR
jgi:hypothetical protein